MTYSAPNLPTQYYSIDTGNSGIGVIPSPSSVAWATANLARYVPIMVNQAIVVKKLWYSNGTTATGNYDIGLYDYAGAALLRKGSTAKTTTAEEIVWDCTDTPIGPGLYYMALNNSTTTDTFVCFSSVAPMPSIAGVLTQAVGAVTLPSPATFAQNYTNVLIPLMGILTVTTVS